MIATSPSIAVSMRNVRPLNSRVSLFRPFSTTAPDLSSRTGISPSCKSVSSLLASLNQLTDNVRAAVGVKNAGMPAPAARMRSANVPWGQSSIANSPVKYFFSNTLLFPRYDRIRRSTWPALVSVAKPPLPSTPALFDTAVSELRESRPLLFSAPIKVSATPQSPKPELSSVEPLLMSATAASASLKSFDPPRTASAGLDVLNWRAVKLLPHVRGLARSLSSFDMIAVMFCLVQS